MRVMKSLAGELELMGKINGANIKKAFYYLKRNGLLNTWYAVRERMDEKEAYCFTPPAPEALLQQTREAEELTACFSIVVPAYRTKREYLLEMIESVRSQSYPRWELILADATEDDRVKKEAEAFQDERIRYIRLSENAGIAENTNRALSFVKYPYTGLLDHDDVLTPDALYEMALSIEQGKRQGIALKMLYSDEDKCNGDRTRYYEPNRKEDFNLDLLCSNNYICHFLVMDSVLLKETGFRREYDGAQDFDMVLRASGRILKEWGESAIAHVPKVLYHWRCHEASTAQNPASKEYAYLAGQRAVQDFADQNGFQARAGAMKHLGFYELEYEEDIFQAREDIGAVGGKLLRNGKVAGGRYIEEGKLLYGGLPAGYSGYLHRAVLQQDAEAVDIRLIKVRKECWELFEQTLGVPYVPLSDGETFDCSVLPGNMDLQEAGLALGRALRSRGYRILWQPSWMKKLGRGER